MGVGTIKSHPWILAVAVLDPWSLMFPGWKLIFHESPTLGSEALDGINTAGLVVLLNVYSILHICKDIPRGCNIHLKERKDLIKCFYPVSSSRN